MAKTAIKLAALGTEDSGLTSCDVETITSKSWRTKTCPSPIKYVLYDELTDAQEWGFADATDLSSWISTSKNDLAVSDFFKDLSADGKTISYNEAWAAQKVRFFFFY